VKAYSPAKAIQDVQHVVILMQETALSTIILEQCEV
jgi:hypothetical protein